MSKYTNCFSCPPYRIYCLLRNTPIHHIYHQHMKALILVFLVFTMSEVSKACVHMLLMKLLMKYFQLPYHFLVCLSIRRKYVGCLCTWILHIVQVVPNECHCGSLTKWCKEASTRQHKECRHGEGYSSATPLLCTQGSQEPLLLCHKSQPPNGHQQPWSFARLGLCYFWMVTLGLPTGSGKGRFELKLAARIDLAGQLLLFERSSTARYHHIR